MNGLVNGFFSRFLFSKVTLTALFCCIRRVEMMLCFRSIHRRSQSVSIYHCFISFLFCFDTMAILMISYLHLPYVRCIYGKWKCSGKIKPEKERETKQLNDLLVVTVRGTCDMCSSLRLRIMCTWRGGVAIRSVKLCRKAPIYLLRKLIAHFALHTM